MAGRAIPGISAGEGEGFRVWSIRIGLLFCCRWPFSDVGGMCIYPISVTSAGGWGIVRVWSNPIWLSCFSVASHFQSGIYIEYGAMYICAIPGVSADGGGRVPFLFNPILTFCSAAAGWLQVVANLVLPLFMLVFLAFRSAAPSGES